MSGRRGEHGAHRERPVAAEAGVDGAPFGRVLALDAEEQEGFVERLADADVEQLVRLLEQQLVGPLGADDVAPEPMGALGLVHRHVVERAAVVGPRRRGHLLDRPRQRRAVAELLHEQGEVAAAGEVGAVGEPRGVARDRRDAQAQERLAVRERIEIEQRLVDAGRIEAPLRRRSRAGAGSADTARRARVCVEYHQAPLRIGTESSSCWIRESISW